MSYWLIKKVLPSSHSTIISYFYSWKKMLFILLMQLANEAQILNITFLLTPLYVWPWAAVSSAVIVPLTSIYASLYSHKLDLGIEFLNLIWLSLLNVPRDLLFILIKFSVLNLDGWFGVVSEKSIIFWYFIIILSYQSQIINNFLRSFWRYINLSLSRYFFIILICNFLWTILWWPSWNFCSSISNFITNETTSCFCCFLNYYFWRSFKCIYYSSFSTIKSFFGCIYHVHFNSSFYQYFCRYFQWKTKIHSLLQIFDL